MTVTNVTVKNPVTRAEGVGHVLYTYILFSPALLCTYTRMHVKQVKPT